MPLTAQTGRAYFNDRKGRARGPARVRPQQRCPARGFLLYGGQSQGQVYRDGSRAMKAYVKAKGLAINECGKLVVAQNEAELAQLDELLRRGQRKVPKCV